MGYDNFSFTKEQLAMLEERDQTIGDLQFSLDERTAQLEEVEYSKSKFKLKLVSFDVSFVGGHLCIQWTP